MEGDNPGDTFVEVIVSQVFADGRSLLWRRAPPRRRSRGDEPGRAVQQRRQNVIVGQIVVGQVRESRQSAVDIAGVEHPPNDVGSGCAGQPLGAQTPNQLVWLRPRCLHEVTDGQQICLKAVAVSPPPCVHVSARAQFGEHALSMASDQRLGVVVHRVGSVLTSGQ
jgi:hypothetical protein